MRKITYLLLGGLLAGCAQTLTLEDQIDPGVVASEIPESDPAAAREDCTPARVSTGMCKVAEIIPNSERWRRISYGTEETNNREIVISFSDGSLDPDDEFLLIATATASTFTGHTGKMAGKGHWHYLSTRKLPNDDYKRCSRNRSQITSYGNVWADTSVTCSLFIDKTFNLKSELQNSGSLQNHAVSWQVWRKTAD